jgi:sugar/nucleoside kinase (ribokinase family)
VTFCGRCAADDVSRHVAALADHGVEALVTGDPERSTATVVLLVDQQGERTMFVDRGANAALAAGDVPDDAWQDVDWLHLTGYTFFDPSTRPVAARLVAEARDRGVCVSVDPSSVAFLRAIGPEEFLGWIDGADLLLPNIDEARVLIGAEGPQIDLEILAARFPHVVVTLGSMGAAYVSGVQRAQVTAPRIEVVDTTGAGDAFAAGFLSRWMAGGTPDEALDAGRAAAETCVMAVGARPAATGRPGG